MVQPNRRTATLTDEDIENIVAALAHQKETCRFSDIQPEDMRAAVDFFKSVSRGLEESKSAFRKTVITLLVGAFFSFLGTGVGYTIYIVTKKYVETPSP